MSVSERERREISELASAAVDGRLNEAGRQRLESVLAGSPEARQFYVQFMGVSAGLAWLEQGGRGTAIEFRRELAAEGRRSFWQRAWLPYGAVAAVALLVLLLWLTRKSPLPAPEPTVNGVAVLIDAIQVKWEGDREPPHVANMLPAGVLRLKAGLAQIQFLNGATVWLEGPAELNLRSAREAYCASGKLLVDVPAKANGFCVRSPYMNVVDRSTGFGVEVRPESNGAGRATVHVFRGQVDITIGEGNPMPVLAGCAVMVDAHGSMCPMPADLRAFEHEGFAGGLGSFGGLAPGAVPEHPHGPGGWEHGPPGEHGPGGPDGRWGEGGWKGGDPLDFARQQLCSDDARWAVIGPKLAEVIKAQWSILGVGEMENLLASRVRLALLDLDLATRDAGSPEADLAKKLQTLRAARTKAREKLAGAEEALKAQLTPQEEGVLVEFGYLR